MRTHTGVFGVVVALATLVLGCSQGSTPTWTAPAVTTPTPPPPDTNLYSLSGVVFEVTSAGRVPVQGVEVYCEPCGPPDGHSFRKTDAQGAYSFEGPGGVARARIDVLVAKPGYVLPGQPDQSGPSGLSWMGKVVVTVTGDTRYDIEIARK